MPEVSTPSQTPRHPGRHPGRTPNWAEDDAPGDPDANITIMLLGTALAVLAPLAGFLGGSMVGSTLDADSLDPMFFWFFGGLVVGGVGAVVAFLGGLRWFHAQRGVSLTTHPDHAA